MSESTSYLKNNKDALRDSVKHHLKYSLGHDWHMASKRDIFWAVSLAVRDRLHEKLIETELRYAREDVKRVYYLSMEFLMGRSLGNNLYNLGIYDVFREALMDLDIDIEEVRESEMDAALGNGGLGRLAACFLDSMASMDIPGYGYGINYKFGHFRQSFSNGYQKESADNWLNKGNPWQIMRPEMSCMIPLYGRIKDTLDRNGEYNPMWVDWDLIIGVPYDMPVVGYGGKTVNRLRLYSAKSSEEFKIEFFNEGDYFEAVRDKIHSEAISKVLYPSDSIQAGRELRMVQEYFFVACALKDITRRHLQTHKNFHNFHSKVAIQLNDTHPSIAIAELMRIFVDQNSIPWETAWEITRQTFAYTNHTLLVEALEKWPVSMFRHVIPRHLQIIYEINARFLEKVATRWPDEPERLTRMSLIEEGEVKKVRMTHLAIVGSHSINGVSAIHTSLLKNTLFNDFKEMWPEKFNNKTNGVTQRRWLLKANRPLTDLICAHIGKEWIRESSQLARLAPLAGDEEFREKFRKIKLLNKKKLAEIVFKTTQVKVNPQSLFDIHAKRIHEYKRQLLKIMHIIDTYLAITEDGVIPEVPRTFIFAGKAAPGYWTAKHIVKLINNVAKTINTNPRVNDHIKIAFIPDYRVSLAESIIPAADLSEQISTAGKEASGTGNMKFALNGALTVGTLDGANIEIMEAVGKENIFIFGHNTDELRNLRHCRHYNPWDLYEKNPRTKRVMNSFGRDVFCRKEPGLFKWVFDALLYRKDDYFHLADLESYLDIQDKIDKEFSQTDTWTKKTILNVAQMGRFSSDRTISEYAEEIWGVKSIP